MLSIYYRQLWRHVAASEGPLPVPRKTSALEEKEHSSRKIFT